MNRVKKMMKAREAGSLLFLALLILLVGLVNSETPPQKGLYVLYRSR